MVLAHVIGLTMGQSLVGSSLTLCPVLVHALLVGRTHFGCSRQIRAATHPQNLQQLCLNPDLQEAFSIGPTKPFFRLTSIPHEAHHNLSSRRRNILRMLFLTPYWLAGWLVLVFFNIQRCQCHTKQEVVTTSKSLRRLTSTCNRVS